MPSGKRPGQDKLFLSYSRKDEGLADRLRTALEARGFDVLMDRKEIEVFEKWWERIQNLIASAHAVVFLVTNSWVSSDICRKEVEFSASLKKRLAPVLAEPVDSKRIPEQLRSLNFFRLHEDQSAFEEDMDTLVRGLTTDIEWLRRRQEIATDAWQWDRNGRADEYLMRAGVRDNKVLEELKKILAERRDELDTVSISYIQASTGSQLLTRVRWFLVAIIGFFVLLGLLQAAQSNWLTAIFFWVVAGLVILGAETIHPLFDFIIDSITTLIATCVLYVLAFGLLAGIGPQWLESLTTAEVRAFFVWGLLIVGVAALLVRAGYRKMRPDKFD